MSRAEGVRMEDSGKDQSNLLSESTASDEHIDPYCELCVEDKKRRIAAVGLCKECNAFVCQQCINAHSRWPRMRNHKILQGDEMPRTQAEKPVKFPDCEIHRENVKDHFCLDHQEMLCSHCTKSFHGTCKRTTIHELCKSLDKGDVRKFRDSIQNAIRIASSVKLTIHQNKDDIENQRRRAIKEAEDLKKRLDTKIKSITVDDTSITEFCKQETLDLENRTEAVSNAVQSLQNESSILDKFDGDAVTPNMFISLRRIAEHTKAAHKQLDEVCNQLRSVRISFVSNPAITSFLFSKNELGEIEKESTDSDALPTLPEINFPPKPPSLSQSLEINKRMHLVFVLAYLLVYLLVFLPYPLGAFIKRSAKMNLTDTKPSDLINDVGNQLSDIMDVLDRKPCDIFKMTLTKKSPVDVKQSDDLDKYYFIRGMVVTTNGTLLLTDFFNKKVMAFASDGTFLSSLSLSSWTWAIALINATTAVVSTEDQKLHFLNISLPSVLSIQMSVYLGYKIYDLTVYNNKLIVMWYLTDNVWFMNENVFIVKMLDLGSHEIWSTSSDSSGQTIFSWPGYLITKAVNGTETVIVTDPDNDHIVFLDVDDGKLINTIEVEGKRPLGLTVDNDDNVYINFEITHELSVWSPDFSQSRILLSNNQLLGMPDSVAYSEITGELFISYYDSSIVDRFQITCK